MVSLAKSSLGIGKKWAIFTELVPNGENGGVAIRRGTAGDEV